MEALLGEITRPAPRLISRSAASVAATSATAAEAWGVASAEKHGTLAAEWLQRRYRRDENATPPQYVARGLAEAAVSEAAAAIERAGTHALTSSALHLVTGSTSASETFEMAAHQLLGEPLVGACLRLPSANAAISSLSAGKLTDLARPGGQPRQPGSRLVSRTFSGGPRPVGDSAVLQVLSALPQGALLQFETPWQAGGLGLTDLAAHRVYLRRMADTLADKLADALAADATAPAPDPSLLADELCAHARLVAIQADRVSERTLPSQLVVGAVDFLLAAVNEARAQWVPPPTTPSTVETAAMPSAATKKKIRFQPASPSISQLPTSQLSANGTQSVSKSGDPTPQTIESPSIAAPRRRGLWCLGCLPDLKSPPEEIGHSGR